ncbi:MAG: antibiotic biosynthesis monooxygenase [Anaerolineae bacterium]|nr:antibiotic biosynthesis monooxygenase [Anaerolineae bacterium]
MIVIRVTFKINPTERVNLLPYLQQNSTESRQFAGCLNYGFYQDTGDENTFLLYEEWDTQANFDAFKGSANFKASGDVLFPLMVGKPESVYYAANTLS